MAQAKKLPEVQSPEKSIKEPQSSPSPKPESNKYARKPKVRPTIGKNQIGGPKERVTPKFNSVRTELH